MGAHQDFVQGAVIIVAAMMGTLCDGTLNTLVGMAIHRLKTSFDLDSEIVWAEKKKLCRQNSPILLSVEICGMVLYRKVCKPRNNV